MQAASTFRQLLNHTGCESAVPECELDATADASPRANQRNPLIRSQVT
jgi:hypothetical protein